MQFLLVLKFIIFSDISPHSRGCKLFTYWIQARKIDKIEARKIGRARSVAPYRKRKGPAAKTFGAAFAPVIPGRRAAQIRRNGWRANVVGDARLAETNKIISTNTLSLSALSPLVRSVPPINPIPDRPTSRGHARIQGVCVFNLGRSLLARETCTVSETKPRLRSATSNSSPTINNGKMN